jgi:hypothetical protein
MHYLGFSEGKEKRGVEVIFGGNYLRDADTVLLIIGDEKIYKFDKTGIFTF